MARRIRMFQVAGIDVLLDSSWLLCAGLVAWTLARDIFPEMTPELPAAVYWWMAVAATIGLFISIIGHELAHSLVARGFGIEIKAITLFIFGGVAEMDREPEGPRSEFLIAGAGPIASLMLAGLIFALEFGAEAAGAPDALIEVLWYLVFVNAALALFNFIPAFPLDGGRMFRALLWAWRGDLMVATSIAAAGGNLFGIFLMALGLYHIIGGDVVMGAWDMLLGLFLRGAASTCREETATRWLLAGVPVSVAMNSSPVCLSPSLSVAAFAEQVAYVHPHHSYPVTEGGELVGVAALDRISLTAPSARSTTRIRDLMARPADSEIISPETGLLTALHYLRQGPGRKLWVVNGRDLAGLLTLHDVQEHLAARIALESRLPRWTKSPAPR